MVYLTNKIQKKKVSELSKKKLKLPRILIEGLICLYDLTKPNFNYHFHLSKYPRESSDTFFGYFLSPLDYIYYQK